VARIDAYSTVRDRCASAVPGGVHSPRRRRIGSTPSHAQTGGVGHADAGRAFRLARRRFVAGERLDMGALAADLGLLGWTPTRPTWLDDLRDDSYYRA